MRYEVIVSAQELIIERCNTINPATRLPLSVDGSPHSCEANTTAFLKVYPELHTEPIDAQLTLFVDGSCFMDGEGRHAGYAVA